jgi:asparagine synthase (glutamine-hydrolysing)
MATRLAHRGPDGAGVWVDADGSVALAHRRLAIVDLSAAGHQPMSSASNRYELIFNGEIYNHMALRADLQGCTWRGHSDTETLLAGFEQWGIEKTLQKAVGMFAIALWDRRLRRLTLARDRMGEKPLYYGTRNGLLLFASELKAFKAHPDFHPAIDADAVALLMRHNCIPAPYSIYRDVKKLPPATLLHIDQASSAGEPQAYWSLRSAVDQGRSNPFSGTDAAATDRLEDLLDGAIALQRVADVPLGAFLSGGVDSSLIVALMQRQSATAVRTFTIGFEDPRFDEAMHARAVARHRAAGARHRSPHADAVLRTLCRFIPGPHLPGGRDGTPACHGVAVGRCGRRVVRRLCPLCHGTRLVVTHLEGSLGRARDGRSGHSGGSAAVVGPGRSGRQRRAATRSADRTLR